MEGRPLVRSLATALAVAAVAVGAPAASPAHATAQQVFGERYHPFQQGVHYTIEARQDDETHVLTGRASLRYTNRAPEALERLYFHQYLNAFRPNSAWARYDLRFDNRTFQDLGPEEHGFERIQSFTVDGQPVQPVYPESPDSTVFYVELPSPLQPGASLEATIDWTARAATEPRRQGRRGRHYDYAHWYPRVAVYGADGWEYRPHIRPGELNGTFGTYDVTLDLAEDQVIGATGVPVTGDPGWERVASTEPTEIAYARDAYGDVSAAPVGLLEGTAETGRKRIHWHARNVHNFAWSTSPDYRYLGAVWQGKPLHLLWEPATESWDATRILREQFEAMEWVEELVGEYPWPQLTVTDRVESGATEFPMLYMTSGGAVVHETMHMIAHGILANNEWKQGWLDEGMASFLTSWLTEEMGAEPTRVWGGVDRYAQLDQAGQGEPVGLPGAEFGSYRMYSTMTYGKGSAILYMLREMLGEETFREGFREYYDRHRFSQVTAEDFEQVMEEVSGEELDWFFDQWLGTTDWLDYSVGDVQVEGGPGAWRVRAEVVREGDAWMPVNVRAGAQTVRLESRDARQWITFRLDELPESVVVDPGLAVADADRENNVAVVPEA